MPEIKFTPFGIPYLLEFANVSIRTPSSCKSNPLKPKIGNQHSHSEKGEGDAADEDKENLNHASGLYIQHPSQRPSAIPRKISERRVARLKRTIADAVTQVGMSSPAAVEVSNPMDALPAKTVQRQALFKGTYGQVKVALHTAGLIATPCGDSGLENATRLGILFVVNSKNKKGDGLELTKLTLWG